MKNILFCLTLVCLSLNACNHNSERKCDLLLKKANRNLYQFYLSNDTALLYIAKEYLDSIDCESFKYKVFSTKTALFILLKEYSEGIKYIKSLNAKNFNQVYQRNMYLKSFEAMQSESMGDTIKSKKLYTEIIEEIQKYLQTNSNREALVDLFYIKSKIERREKVIQEINHLKTTGKYDNNSIDLIIATIANTRNEVKSFAIPISK